MPEKTIENLIRVEISKEFKIPVICPPSNRVTDNIASAIRQLIKEELEKRLPAASLKLKLNAREKFIWLTGIQEYHTAIAEFLGEGMREIKFRAWDKNREETLMFNCKCGFEFSGPGELRNCEAFVVNGKSGVVCPQCNKKYIDGKEFINVKSHPTPRRA